MTDERKANSFELDLDFALDALESRSERPSAAAESSTRAELLRILDKPEADAEELPNALAEQNDVETQPRANADMLATKVGVSEEQLALSADPNARAIVRPPPLVRAPASSSLPAPRKGLLDRVASRPPRAPIEFRLEDSGLLTPQLFERIRSTTNLGERLGERLGDERIVYDDDLDTGQHARSLSAEEAALSLDGEELSADDAVEIIGSGPDLGAAAARGALRRRGKTNTKLRDHSAIVWHEELEWMRAMSGANAVAETKMWEAEIAAANGKIGQALGFLDARIDADPTDVEALRNRRALSSNPAFKLDTLRKEVSLPGVPEERAMIALAGAWLAFALEQPDAARQLLGVAERLGASSAELASARMLDADQREQAYRAFASLSNSALGDAAALHLYRGKSFPDRDWFTSELRHASRVPMSNAGVPEAFRLAWHLPRLLREGPVIAELSPELRAGDSERSLAVASIAARLTGDQVREEQALLQLFSETSSERIAEWPALYVRHAMLRTESELGANTEKKDSFWQTWSRCAVHSQAFDVGVASALEHAFGGKVRLQLESAFDLESTVRDAMRAWQNGDANANSQENHALFQIIGREAHMTLEPTESTFWLWAYASTANQASAQRVVAEIGSYFRLGTQETELLFLLATRVFAIWSAVQDQLVAQGWRPSEEERASGRHATREQALCFYALGNPREMLVATAYLLASARGGDMQSLVAKLLERAADAILNRDPFAWAYVPLLLAPSARNPAWLRAAQRADGSSFAPLVALGRVGAGEVSYGKALQQSFEAKHADVGLGLARLALADVSAALVAHRTAQSDPVVAEAAWLSIQTAIGESRAPFLRLLGVALGVTHGKGELALQHLSALIQTRFADVEIPMWCAVLGPHLDRLLAQSGKRDSTNSAVFLEGEPSPSPRPALRGSAAADRVPPTPRFPDGNSYSLEWDGRVRPLQLKTAYAHLQSDRARAAEGFRKRSELALDEEERVLFEVRAMEIDSEPQVSHWRAADLEDWPVFTPWLDALGVQLVAQENIGAAALVLARSATAVAHPNEKQRRAYEAALMLERLDKDQDAVAALESASEVSLQYRDVFVRLRALYEARGEHLKLSQLIGRRLREGVAAAEMIQLHLYDSAIRDRAGDRKGATAAVRAALAVDADCVDALRRLTAMCLEEGDYNTAAEALIRVARLQKDRDELRWVFYTLGDIYERHLPDTRRAEAAFRRVLQLVPDDAEAHERLAGICKKEERFAEAADLVERLAWNGDPAAMRERRLELAYLRELAGQPAEAEQVLLRAAQTDPSHPAVLRAVRDHYTRQRNSAGLASHLETTMGVLQRALIEGPLDRALLESMIELLIFRGQPRAANFLRTFLEHLDPENQARTRTHIDTPLSTLPDSVLAPSTLSAEVRALFLALAPFFDRMQSVDPKHYSAVPLRKVETRAEVLAVAAALAKEYPKVEVLVSTDTRFRLVASPLSSTPVLLFGQGLLHSLEAPTLHFLLLRAAKIASVGLSTPMRIAGAELPKMLASLSILLADSKVRPEPGALEWYKRLDAAIPSRARTDLREKWRRAADQLDASRIAMAAAELGDRAALTRLGDLRIALTALVQLAGEAAPRDLSEWNSAIGRTPELASLLRFAVGDAFLRAWDAPRSV